jgi:glycogen debranching enzyme GlgX
MNTKSGSPSPLGLSFEGDQVNFSLHVHEGISCTLLIYDRKNNLKYTLPLNPQLNKTGSIWHISLDYASIKEMGYEYLINDKHKILDPYAKFLNTSTKWSEGAKPGHVKGLVLKPDPFDWEQTECPNQPLKDLIIYEMHVRSFTIEAKVKHPGTFLGIIEKIPHFKALGINAIELMPIHEFNECENPHAGLYNYWGYSPLAYFAFMQRYGSTPGNVLNEFKMLVKALHKEKIAIIIDVVYNHTAEGGKNGPHYHFKDLDPHYYLKDHHGEFVDYSGCGNTLDANHFPSYKMILDSLKYLAVDCHVDGFRFDLASTFYRSNHEVLSHPRIMESILDDPVLSKKILIAEAWDARGLYQVGKFPKPFADWNGAYRDKVRAFLKHDHHSKGAFADAVSGTHSLYGSKTPDLSINFITAHDGFTLHDLFSYNHKHNLANGENNRDGSDQNLSYNCGHEGPTTDPVILDKREKLQSASFAILLLSLGTPMLLMGDEYGHTREGNNNAYCQDNKLNYFLWDKVDNHQIEKIGRLIQIRHHIKRLCSDKFYDSKEISWHGLKYKNPAWDKDDGFLSFHIHDGFFIIFNLSSEKKTILIPEGSWHEIFHSQKNHSETNLELESSHFLVDELSVILLSKKPFRL